jgi:proline dehydrogenase
MKHEHGFDNVGAVIQAYLYRSEADLRQLIADGIQVRLCKGAYDEPPEIAYPQKADVDRNFVHLARLMLDAVADEPRPGGPTFRRPAFATHDTRMVDAACADAESRGVDRAAIEFQMLNGIRPGLQTGLARQGYPVRVYVPYGSEWYPYFMRRLAERPANLWFFIVNFLRRA